MTAEYTSPPVFWRTGKKTLLRPLELSDAPTLYRGINDPETSKFLNAIHPMGLGYEEDWIKEKQKPSTTDVTVAICLLDGTMIGTMGLHRIDLLNRTATTGAVIFEEQYRNRGYGSDAKMLLLDAAFNRYNLFKVQSRVIAYNGRSAAYSKKCGYVEEGRLRDQWERFGQRHDEILLAVFRDYWLPLWEQYQRELSGDDLDEPPEQKLRNIEF